MDKRVKRAIDRFHERFFPEAKVSYLGSNDKGEMAFAFSGHFCLTCGLHDYFEDFAEMLSEEMGEEYVPSEKIPVGMGYSAWVVVFSPRRIAKPAEERAKFLILDKEGRVEGLVEV